MQLHQLLEHLPPRLIFSDNICATAPASRMAFVDISTTAEFKGGGVCTGSRGKFQSNGNCGVKEYLKLVHN